MSYTYTLPKLIQEGSFLIFGLLEIGHICSGYFSKQKKNEIVSGTKSFIESPPPTRFQKSVYKFPTVSVKHHDLFKKWRAC